MYNKNAFALAIMTVGFVLFSSCGLGLSPSVKEDQTSVSLRLASLGTNAAGNPSRAVMPGTNYLYIRTIGIEGKTSGALYGPYAVSAGSDFVTGDIPAGEYDRFYVVCSGKDLESEARTFSFLGGTYTFHELLSLPDSQMVSFASSDVDKTELDAFFDGEVTFGEKDGVTLLQGKTNSLSLTLAPITSAGYTLNVGASRAQSFSSTARSQHFYRLSGIKVQLPVTQDGFSCAISAASASAGTLSAIAFFSSTGEQVPVTNNGTDLASGQTWTIDAATLASIAQADGTVELYQYVDYTGDLTAQYAYTAGSVGTPASPSTPSGLTVSFDGDATSAYQGRKLLFKLYDTDTITKVKGGASWSQVSPFASGIIDLDATSGDGSVQIPVNLVSGATYYLSALVSSTGHYSDMTSLSGVDLQTIVPYKNDLVVKADDALVAAGINECMSVTGGGSIALTAAQFTPYTSSVIFVSNTDNSDLMGDTPSDSATFAHAINAANGGSAAETVIYLTSDVSGVTMNNDTAVRANVVIRSYGSTPFVIRPTTNAVKTIDSSYSVLYVAAAGTLSCQDIVIDGSELESSSSPLCYVAGGKLNLGPNTVLKGADSNNKPAYGGGVYVGANGRLSMTNATIMHCYAESCGGAIYANYGSPSGGYVELKGNSILDGNSVPNAPGGYGSAIYLAGNTTLDCEDGSIIRNSHGYPTAGTICVLGSAHLVGSGIIFEDNNETGTIVHTGT